LNPDVPPELDRVTLRALSRSPDDRFASCEDMATELDHVVHQLKWGPERLRAFMFDLFGDEPPETQAGASGEQHASRTTFGVIKRRKRLQVVAMSAAGALAVAGAVWLYTNKQKPAQVQTPTPVVVAPTPTPAPPPAPAEVRVRISSNPLGAEVFVGDEAAARGRTPLVMKLPRGEEVVKLQLKLAGFQSEPFEVTPDSDQQVQAAMVKAAPARAGAPAKARPQPKHVVIKKEPAKPPKGKAPDLKRGDVVDPFAR
jgi:hypothetical protein